MLCDRSEAICYSIDFKLILLEIAFSAYIMVVVVVNAKKIHRLELRYVLEKNLVHEAEEYALRTKSFS